MTRYSFASSWARVTVSVGLVFVTTSYCADGVAFTQEEQPEAPLPVATQPRNNCAVPIATESPTFHPQQAVYRQRLHSIATGAGVKVAVIDTGVARHPTFGEVKGVADVLDNENPDPLFDCDIHGTVVAGVIASDEIGIAPEAEILSIRQTSARTAGSMDTLTAALHHALDAGAHVINISVVSCVEGNVDTHELDAALRRAEDDNVVVVAAAGNRGGECTPDATVYPAHADTVLVVSAVETPGQHADYALSGEIAAPGYVTHAPHISGTGWMSGTVGGDGFHGTSFAAPTIAGTAALLRQLHPDATAAEVRKTIESVAEAHTGFVDPLAAVTFLSSEHFGNSVSLVAQNDNEQDQQQIMHAVEPPTRPHPYGWLALLTIAALVSALSRLRSGPGGSSRSTDHSPDVM
ncbi:MAG: S8 family serine peptidase [Corynebacterium sp.]|nr:S8 family serine peptidase [Corynebacterium sp.]